MLIPILKIGDILIASIQTALTDKEVLQFQEDVLNEVYGFDNSEFLDYLEDRGFYIAEQSHSNYLQTSLSLASSLNFEYLEELNEIGKKTVHREPIGELISNSKVRTYLEVLGYQFVSFDSGYIYSDIKSADTYLSPFISINEFEKLFFTFSIAVMLDNREDNLIPFFTYNSHRTRLLYTLDQLKNVAELPGPKFVFAHLMIPHPPFVFDDFGNPIIPDQAFDLRDANSFPGTRSEYIQGYTDQVKFTNRQIEMVVDAILNSSSSPPIIIIQGDHGPKMLINFDSIEDSCIRESASILNAYYLPESGRDALYPTISPVNSFRIILNTYFGTQFNLLEDKTYFSNFLQPFNFVDVTERRDEICSLENVN